MTHDHREHGKPANLIRVVRSLPTFIPHRQALRPSPIAPEATSSDIAAAIDGSFEGGPASKTRIVDNAERALAGTAVMRLLHQLPNIRYRSASDVWKHLPNDSARPADQRDDTVEAATGRLGIRTRRQ